MRYTGLGSEALVGLKRLQVDVVRKGLRVVVGRHARQVDGGSEQLHVRSTDPLGDVTGSRY